MPHPLKILSGGQSGVDQAALRAADRCGVPTGGYAPQGWLAEVLISDEHGPIRWRTMPCPWLAGHGLIECSTPGFPDRTKANVKIAEAIIWLGKIHTKGYSCTHDEALKINTPFLIVYSGLTKPSEVAAWILERKARLAMVAGNHESVSPGIGERAERFIVAVLERLGYREIKESNEQLK